MTETAETLCSQKGGQKGPKPGEGLGRGKDEAGGPSSSQRVPRGGYGSGFEDSEKSQWYRAAWVAAYVPTASNLQQKPSAHIRIERGARRLQATLGAPFCILQTSQQHPRWDRKGQTLRDDSDRPSSFSYPPPPAGPSVEFHNQHLGLPFHEMGIKNISPSGIAGHQMASRIWVRCVPGKILLEREGKGRGPVWQVAPHPASSETPDRACAVAFFPEGKTEAPLG